MVWYAPSSLGAINNRTEQVLPIAENVLQDQVNQLSHFAHENEMQLNYKNSRPQDKAPGALAPKLGSTKGSPLYAYGSSPSSC